MASALFSASWMRFEVASEVAGPASILRGQSCFRMMQIEWKAIKQDRQFLPQMNLD